MNQYISLLFPFSHWLLYNFHCSQIWGFSRVHMISCTGPGTRSVRRRVWAQVWQVLLKMMRALGSRRQRLFSDTDLCRFVVGHITVNPKQRPPILTAVDVLTRSCAPWGTSFSGLGWREGSRGGVILVSWAFCISSIVCWTCLIILRWDSSSSQTRGCDCPCFCDLINGNL